MKCRKYTESKNPKVVKTKNGIIMPLPKCAVCDSKKSKFAKDQEARGLISKLTWIKLLILSNLSIENLCFKSIK